MLDRLRANSVSCIELIVANNKYDHLLKLIINYFFVYVLSIYINFYYLVIKKELYEKIILVYIFFIFPSRFIIIEILILLKKYCL